MRDIWEIYDKTLEFVPVGDVLAIGTTLAGRDVHLAWAIWSAAAEGALVRAFGWRMARLPRWVWFVVGGLLCSG